MQPNPPRPRANAAAAVTAGILAVLTVGMLVWFAFYNVVVAYELVGRFTGLMLVNVLGGALGAGVLLVAAGFTFTRRIAGAWTLCGLCGLYVVSIFVLAPLLFGTPFSAQFTWIFSFDDSDSTVMALAVVFGVLTAITAAVAAGVKSYEPPASRS